VSARQSVAVDALMRIQRLRDVTLCDVTRDVSDTLQRFDETQQNATGLLHNEPTRPTGSSGLELKTGYKN